MAEPQHIPSKFLRHGRLIFWMATFVLAGYAFWTPPGSGSYNRV